MWPNNLRAGLAAMALGSVFDEGRLDFAQHRLDRFVGFFSGIQAGETDLLRPAWTKHATRANGVCTHTELRGVQGRTLTVIG